MLQHTSHGKTTTHKRPNKDTSCNGQGTADAKTTATNDPNEDASRSRRGEGAADARVLQPVRLCLVIIDMVTSAHIHQTQQATTPPQPSAAGVHLTVRITSV